MAYRVVADHIRTLCFAIADGSRPGNEGREYVLRRVLRRGVRYGREVLGGPEGFFSSLVDTVVECLGDMYPELGKHRDRIVEIIREEETAFSRTLVKGIDRFKKMAASTPAGGRLSGHDAFVLWDTFGFPLDLTQLMAEEAGMTVDVDGFAVAMEEAKELSRASAKKGGGAGIKFEAEATAWLSSNGIPRTDDSYKYAALSDSALVVHSKIVAILTRDGYVSTLDLDNCDSAEDGVLCGIVLDRTPFYAESGGQVADTGSLCRENNESELLRVVDTISAAGYVLHLCQVDARDARDARDAVSSKLGQVSVGDEIVAAVDVERRSSIMPNHTYTHVLNFALRKVLGDHVEQRGSIVQPERLRFDFTNNGPVDAAALKEVEGICKGFLSTPRQVYAEDVPLAKAKDINCLRAVFGEVYPDPVRVVSVGKPVAELLEDPRAEGNWEYPVEFCGGTHLSDTIQATEFALISEEGIAKGIRRIVAVTGREAAEAVSLADELEHAVGELKARDPAGGSMNAGTTDLKIRIDQAAIPAVRKAELRAQVAEVAKAVFEEQKKVAAANKAKAVNAAIAAADSAIDAGAKFLVTKVENVGLDAKALQEAWNAIQKKHPELAVMFFTEGEDKAMAYAGPLASGSRPP
jgi:alanyl-tRNA synthetase